MRPSDEADELRPASPEGEVTPEAVRARRLRWAELLRRIDPRAGPWTERAPPAAPV